MHSANELISITTQIWYEIWMLHESHHLLVKRHIRTNKIMRSVLKESFLVHARNLIEFFFPQGRQVGKFCAEQFFDDPATWSKGLRPTTLKRDLDLIKQVLEPIAEERCKMDSATTEWASYLMDELTQVIISFFSLRPKYFIPETDGIGESREIDDGECSSQRNRG